MAVFYQFKGMSTTVSLQYVGYPREITIDTDLWAVRVHDGQTPGGKLMLMEQPGLWNGTITGDDGVVHQVVNGVIFK